MEEVENYFEGLEEFNIFLETLRKKLPNISWLGWGKNIYGYCKYPLKNSELNPRIEFNIYPEFTISQKDGTNIRIFWVVSYIFFINDEKKVEQKFDNNEFKRREESHKFQNDYKAIELIKKIIRKLK